jgi:hypothetical protein
MKEQRIQRGDAEKKNAEYAEKSFLREEQKIQRGDAEIKSGERREELLREVQRLGGAV